MTKKSRLFTALVIALLLSIGAYAYSYTTALGTVNVTEPTGDIATCELAPDQPPWESIIPEPDGGDGAPATAILRPSANGDETTIPHQYPKWGEHWEKVGEEVADEWETYVYNGGNYKTDLYNLPNFSGDLGTINSITVYFRFTGNHHPGKGDTTGYAKAAIKTHGMVYEGSEYSQTGTDFVTHSETWMVNPVTSSAWTWDEINDLQIGVSLQGKPGSRYAHCTQVYCVVDYAAEAPPEICGDVPLGNLFVVTPHPDYTGDLVVKVYLVNIADLIKAYQYLNMKLTLQGADEDFELLTLHNGAAGFTLQGCAGGTHTLSVTGGSYCLISDDPSEWEEDWTVVPELYCEVTQR